MDTTKSGVPCQVWNSQSPHSHPYTSSTFPLANLEDNNGNSCRDPDNRGFLWCITSDEDQQQENCGDNGDAFYQNYCDASLDHDMGSSEYNTVRGDGSIGQYEIISVRRPQVGVEEAGFVNYYYGSTG